MPSEQFAEQIAPLVQYLAPAITIGFAAIGAGTGIGFAGAKAVEGMARQPKHNASILKTMLIGQAVAESPAIFALVIAFVILLSGAGVPDAVAPVASAAAILGAAFAMGLSAIGSGFADGYVAGIACGAQARQPEHSGRITMTMLIGQALCESPVIFGLVIASMLLFGADLTGADQAGVMIVRCGEFLGAGLAMGAGAIGPALGISIVAGSAVYASAARPKAYGVVIRTMFIGVAVAESTSIYALVVAFLLFLGVAPG